jgi:hypothetical protein
MVLGPCSFTVFCRALVVGLPLAILTASSHAALGSSQTGKDVFGTWTGQSICVGSRPQCKNEEVVYRFQPVPDKPGVATLLADKIIDGKRVPMYRLEFVIDSSGKTVTCEFTKRTTHGIWQYTIDGDEMAGTLVILPDRSLGRTVKVHRVPDDQIGPAPPIEEY